MKRKSREEFTTVALYARVSSDRQDVDLSVAAQLRALRDFARKNNYVVAREYVDEAESGRIADRPQFRRMLDDAVKPNPPFQEILVWKFSRFTRKREHAVAFKSMLRRRGIRVVSVTEQADGTPTGKLLEAIIESVDEFYSENLAQEMVRGMREAASRGFRVTPNVPFGYQKVYVQDGARKRARLEVNRKAAPLIRRIFDMAAQGRSTLDITKTLNAEGIPSPRGKKWLKRSVHNMLNNEVYTGTLVWGTNARNGAPPVRVKRAFPAIVPRGKFEQVASLLRSRATKVEHPRRTSSPYPLSGLVKCRACRKALTASEAKGGKYTYYVHHSLLKMGKGACDTPRLNSKYFGEPHHLQHPGEHPDRVEHQGPGEDRGRGDGRGGQGAAEEAEDDPEGVGRGEAEAGGDMAADRDHRHGDGRCRRQDQGAQGEEGEAGGGGRRGQDHTRSEESDVGPDRDDHRLFPGHERVSEDQRIDGNADLHPLLRQGDRGEAWNGHHSLHHPHPGGQSHRGRRCREGGAQRRSSQYGPRWWAVVDLNH